MPLQIGIVGLPNVGKSTLFNALVRSRQAQVENYPFCTIAPNVGVVAVPDERLEALKRIENPARVVPATVEFVDIAGLVEGASKGEGLGNQFLSHIRECDAICEVVRLFEDGNVAHVAGRVDAERDVAVIETELILADLQTIEKRKAKYANAAKTGEKEAQEQMAVIAPLMEALGAGRRASSVAVPEGQRAILREMHLLTLKPIMRVANVSEDRVGTPLRPAPLSPKVVLGFAGQAGTGTGTGVVVVCAKVEEDLIDLSPDEAREYRRELGVESSGLDRLIRAAYDVLGLITFFTAGPKEVRAWTVQRGATAPEAAGVIHSDFQRGFICAEVISFDDFVACGGETGAKEKGKMRREGKSYVVADGDVIHFRFNV